MPVSWFSRWRNSSTVEEPSKPTTCRERGPPERGPRGLVEGSEAGRWKGMAERREGDDRGQRKLVSTCRGRVLKAGARPP